MDFKNYTRAPDQANPHQTKKSRFLKVILIITTIVIFLFIAGIFWFMLMKSPATISNESSSEIAPDTTTPDLVQKNLPTINLCGDQNNSEKFLSNIAQKKGETGLVLWFKKSIQVPANIKFCDPIDGKKVFKSVPWIILQKINMKGHPIKNLSTAGYLSENDKGYLSFRINIYPSDSSTFSPFAFILYHKTTP